MSEANCDRSWELDALRDGRLGAKDAEAFERHARTCDVCSVARAQANDLDSWLKEATSADPADIELRRLRIRVLRSADIDSALLGRRRRVGLSFAAALLVATAAFALTHHAMKLAVTQVATQPSTASSSPIVIAPEPMAFVQASDGARWTRSRDGSVERIHVDDGALHIRVRARIAPEQFMMELPDCTIEDHGTTFDVETHGGHTTRVSVSEGSVIIHAAGANDVLVNAGEIWPTPPTAPSAKSTTAHASPSAAATDDGSMQYAAAVSLLRDRKFADAATAFNQYVNAHPLEPDAEDASYLEAVALAQSGDTQGAVRAAERHLASYPGSFHRKEASLLIARIARDAGDCATARKALAPWLGAADGEAIATVRSCPKP